MTIQKSLRQLKGLGTFIKAPYELEVQLRKAPFKTGSGKELFVIAYNDLRTFERCFASSPFVQQKETIAFDNVKNEGLPSIFNRIAKKRSTEDVWLIFCHQDFILKEDLSKILPQLDTDTIYGPIGVRSGDTKVYGQIIQTDNSRSGSRLAKPTLVHTLDEMCLIVNASAFREGLTFDERFNFHFYGADICMNAYVSGFDVCALQLNCQHKSKTIGGDTTSETYLEALALFREKWARFLPIRTTTALIKPLPQTR
jgi:hypothetical protein